MDYAFQQRLLRYLALGVAEDELDWTTHDNRYHGGHFDPKTMTCKARRAADEGDLADVLTAEREEADYKKLAQKLEKERVKRETAESIERKTIAELTSRDYTDEDREIVDAALRHIMTEKPVEVTMKEANAMMRSLRANKPKDVVANMIRHFESTYPDGIEVPGIGKVEVNRASAKSIMAHAQPHGMTLPRWAVIAKLNEICNNSIPFAGNTKWKGRKYDSVSLVSPVKLGDQDKVVELIITKSPSGKLELYNMELRERRMRDSSQP